MKFCLRKVAARYALAAALLPSAALAQSPEPVTADQRVNTSTTGNQYRPAISLLADGGYVIAWIDDEGTSPQYQGSVVRAQRFDASQAAAGSEILVSTTNPGQLLPAAVIGQSGGGFVVVFNDDSRGLFTPDVRYARFNSDGSSAGSIAQVPNDGVVGTFAQEGFALDNSRFAILTNGLVSSGPFGGTTNTYMHFFNDAGVSEGPSVELLPGEGNARAAIFADYSFILVWERNESGDRNIFGRRFHPNGSPDGSEFRINTVLEGRQSSPSVGVLANGQFVVAWNSVLTVGGEQQLSDVNARIFDNDGTPDGTTFMVPITTDGAERSPSVLDLNNGGFLIAWQGDSLNDSDPDGVGIFGRTFQADGVADGNEFRINGQVLNNQTDARFIPLTGGGFVSTFAGGPGNLDADGDALFSVFGASLGRPVLSSITRNGASEQTGDDTLTFAIMFSENVINVSADDFSITGTTGTAQIAGSGAAYTLTVSGGDLSGLNGTVRLGLASEQDIEDTTGNALVSRDPSVLESYMVENTPPTLQRISLDTPSRRLTNSNTLRFYVLFSEPVSNVSGDDFSVIGSTATPTYTSETGRSGWLDVAGGDLDNVNGEVGIDLAPDQDIVDENGNALVQAEPEFSDETYLLDNVAPTVVSIVRFEPANEITSADLLRFILTFSEPVSASSGDFMVSGVTTNLFASPQDATNPVSYRIQLSGGDLGNHNGEVGVAVALDNNVTDEAGNLIASRIPSGANETYTLDNIPPSVSIDGPAGPVNTGYSVTITLSEEVQSFGEDDIDVGNGTLTDFQNIGPLQYSAFITPVNQGATGVTLAEGVVRDAANLGNSEVTYSVVYDSIPPQIRYVQFLVPGNHPTNADTLSFRITFTENVLNVTADDFTIANTTANIAVETIAAERGSIAGTGASQFDITVSGGDLADLDGVVQLGFAAGQNISDLAGNALSDLTPTDLNENSVELDNTPPRIISVERQSPDRNPANGSQFVWRVTFDDVIQNFASHTPTTVRVTNNGEPVGNMTTPTTVGSFEVWDVRVFLPDGFDGRIALEFVPDQGVTDDAGNALVNLTPVGTNLNFYDVDNTPPSVTLQIDPAPPVLGSFTATATFTEPVVNFTAGTLLVRNGTVTNFEAVSDTVYVATITHGPDSTTEINLPRFVIEDLAGNFFRDYAQYIFEVAPHHMLNVAFLGIGEGRVISSPVGIDCTQNCFRGFEPGAAIALTAQPASGSSFGGWVTGPCAGQSNLVCEFTLQADLTASARFTLDAPPEGRIVAAALPGARSSYVGGPVITSFLSVVSRATTPAQACQISAPGDAPFSLTYQELNGAEPVGPLDPVFDLANGGAISFVLAMTPTTLTDADGYVFLPQIECENANLAPIEGVSSVLISIGAAPVPDILSIGATSSGDGVVRIPASGNRIAFMAASAVNIGAGDGSAGANQATVTASVDTGAAVLPVTLEVCESGSTGCISPRGETAIQTVFDQNVAKTFTVFVRANGSETVPFSPANARVFLRFTDSNGSVRSVTSAAISAPPPGDQSQPAQSITGRWSVIIRQEAGDEPVLVRGALYFTDRGDVILDDGISPRRFDLEDVAWGHVPATARLNGYPIDFSRQGEISAGDALTDQPGAFWGIRDGRAPAPTDWRRYEGRFDSVTVTAAGEIRGSIDGCAVYGDTHDGGIISAHVTGCASAGSYLATIDQNPGGDPIALLIAGDNRGWRLERNSPPN
jgi:hypothetical protein